MATRTRTSRPSREVEVVPVRPAWPVVVLAVAGAVLAGYLTATKFAGGQAVLCAAGGGCDIVQASRYATFLGVPTALWGALTYVAVGVLAVLGLTPGRWLAAFLVAVAGASFSLYLTYVSMFELKAACVWCLTSLALVLGLVALLLWLRPRTGARTMVRARRVVPLAVTVGLATIVFGAGVYAWDPEVSAPYAAALANHLGRSGAIMYGAHW